MRYSTGAWIGCGAEKNNLDGFNLDYIGDACFAGGYSEHNHQNWATDNVSDGTNDYSFSINAGCASIKILGGRHIGNIRGANTVAIGNWLMPANYVQFSKLYLDSNENVRLGGGLGIHGVTPPVQSAHIADPSAGGTIDSQARTAINAILVVLENAGFTAAS